MFSQLKTQEFVALDIGHQPGTSNRLVVHHGGVGTSAQCIAAGLPQVVVPSLYNQPDTAKRLERLERLRIARESQKVPPVVCDGDQPVVDLNRGEILVRSFGGRQLERCGLR